MARKKLVTSHDIRKLRVVGGKKGTKRIGKVKSCVFHPTERRCIGFIVKRPDLLWMFHRKDIFVALGGFDDGAACGLCGELVIGEELANLIDGGVFGEHGRPFGGGG